jgi:DNA-binding MarR family transcriptional regulator
MNQEELRRTAMEIHLLGFFAAKMTVQAMERHGLLAEAGISMLQFRVLRALRRRPYTISELSPMLMVDPSTLVAVVDALERKGLAARGRDPHDRRRVPISATEQGANVAASHPKSPFAHLENPLLQSLEALGQERAAQLLTLLRELVSHLPDGEEILKRVATSVRRHSPSERHSPEEIQH